MPQETETYSAETPFAEFLTDTMSGANTVSEHFPEPPSNPSSSDAAGAPPVEPSDATGANPTSPEGASTATSTETPPVVTSEPASATPQEPDPLKDATPLTYTVNGQQRTFDDIKVIPGVGAVIEASALENLTRRLSERDNLFERSQQQYDQVQALERLMTWTQTGQDGKPVEISGPAAIESMRLSLGTALARNMILEQALTDPDTFASLVALDGQNNVVLNPATFQHLGTRAQLAQLEAERIVRSDWAARNAPQQTAPAQVNVQELAPTAVAHYVKEYGDGVLTAEDVKSLERQFRFFTRPPEPEDIRVNPALAHERLVIDPEFFALIQEKSAERKAAATKVGEASSIANENARKLQAALLPNGKAPQQQATQRPVTRPTTPQPSQTQADRDALFLKMEQAAAGAM